VRAVLGRRALRWEYVIVVDDDIDPTNIGQVLWAMATRSRPAQSIDILRETWSTFLGPSLNPPEIGPWGSKALINACIHSSQIALAQELADVKVSVAKQWDAQWHKTPELRSSAAGLVASPRPLPCTVMGSM
jgi:3-polyprenyl-4-hydroxybenzoate decarboxylase